MAQGIVTGTRRKIEPEHFILEAAAPFFVERFRSLIWSILTPIGSANWDRARLSFGPPAQPGDAPAGDAFEAGWRGYYEGFVRLACCLAQLGIVADPNGSDLVFRVPLST
jgi:hypothetical protein